MMTIKGGVSHENEHWDRKEMVGEDQQVLGGEQ